MYIHIYIYIYIYIYMYTLSLSLWECLSARSEPVRSLAHAACLQASVLADLRTVRKFSVSFWTVFPGHGTEKRLTETFVRLEHHPNYWEVSIYSTPANEPCHSKNLHDQARCGNGFYSKVHGKDLFRGGNITWLMCTGGHNPLMFWLCW